jgi:hypothetical protein
MEPASAAKEPKDPKGQTPSFAFLAFFGGPKSFGVPEPRKEPQMSPMRAEDQKGAEGSVDTLVRLF